MAIIPFAQERWGCAGMNGAFWAEHNPAAYELFRFKGGMGGEENIYWCVKGCVAELGDELGCLVEIRPCSSVRGGEWGSTHRTCCSSSHKLICSFSTHRTCCSSSHKLICSFSTHRTCCCFSHKLICSFTM
jgi:hypothetical protein